MLKVNKKEMNVQKMYMYKIVFAPLSRLTITMTTHV